MRNLREKQKTEQPPGVLPDGFLPGIFMSFRFVREKLRARSSVLYYRKKLSSPLSDTARTARGLT